MKVAVLGSGSRGNAVLVTSAAGTLLIDAGFGLSTLRRRAASVSLTLDTLTAVVVTHEHGDHARGAEAAAAAADCPVYGSVGTLRALGLEPGLGRARLLDPERPTAIGGFELRVGRTSHDAAEPIALAICDCPSGTSVGLAYDVGKFTPALRRLLSSVHCLVLEANHDDQLLRTGPYPLHLRRRIAGPTGHLSNWQAGQVAAELYHPALEAVVLAHLSEQCNRPALARETVGAALAAKGYTGKVVVAEQHAALGPITLKGRQLALDLFA